MKSKIISITVLFLAFVSMNSCRKDYHYIPKPVPPPPTPIYFSTDIYPEFSQGSNACTNCHNNALAPDLSTQSIAYNSLITGSDPIGGLYVDTVNASNSFLYLKLTSATPPAGAQMPTGGPYLSADYCAKVLAWIQQGAKNN